MRTNIAAKLLLAGACLIGTAHSWKYQGHILVARMAQDLLEKENPSALKGAIELLDVMKDENITDSEKDHIFVESAPFADMVKYKGGGWQSNWHFVDIPYFDQGGNLKDFPDFHLDAKNITVAIEGVVNWIKGTADHQNSFVYSTIMNYVKGNEQRGKSYALRLLIHYLGDIHQPMHAISRVNKEYPEGDRGGNSFTLPTKYSIKELHATWDAVLYEFRTNDKLPYDAAGWSKLGDSVAKLRSRFTINPSEYSKYDPTEWAEQTYKVGAENAYAGIKENEPLPQSYIDKNNNLAARQLVLASHRLAKTIELMFGKSAESAFLQ